MCSKSPIESYSTNKVMELLCCSRSYLYKKETQAMLGAYKAGNIVKWPLESIEKYINNNKVVYISHEKEIKKSHRKIASNHELW